MMVARHCNYELGKFTWFVANMQIYDRHMDNAKILLERLSECFIVHKNSVLDILHAIEISIKTQFSFWDSLIISAALAEGCSYLYSEDLNSGQSVEGLIIKNPL